MTLFIRQLHPITVYRIVFGVCVVLLLGFILCSFTNFLKSSSGEMDRISVALGFRHDWTGCSVVVQHLCFCLFQTFGHNDDHLMLVPDITMRLLERHGLSNHRILNCLLNSLFNTATKKTSYVRELTLCYNL